MSGLFFKYTIKLVPTNEDGDGDLIETSLVAVDDIWVGVPDIRNIQYPSVLRGPDYVGTDVDFKISFDSVDTDYVKVYAGSSNSNFAQLPKNGTHTFNFTWTAPSTDIGDITFYVTANAANGNGGTSGDHIYSTTLTVGPQAVGGGSVVINEIDADQPAIDNAEFIELFGNPGMSLNGYALVLFNGNNDQSYAAYDLDGYSLDAQGFFVLGNAGTNITITLPTPSSTTSGTFITFKRI